MQYAHARLALRSLTALAAALGLAACSGGEPREASDTGQGPAVQRTGEIGMMEQMQTHMRTMDGVSADSIRARLPVHRQMVANMISQFNQDMRAMSMMSDSAWTATVDSLRHDLTRMPEMSAAALQQLMPAHGGRVTRLMESHRMMMGSHRM